MVRVHKYNLHSGLIYNEASMLHTSEQVNWMISSGDERFRDAIPEDFEI